MGLVDVVIVAAVLAALFLAARRVLRSRGRCEGCSNQACPAHGSHGGRAAAGPVRCPLAARALSDASSRLAEGPSRTSDSEAAQG